MSSAAGTIRERERSPNNKYIATALDTDGSAPLPQRVGKDGTTSCRLFTARVVAEMLDVCPETVLRWIRNGELPAIRLPGGAIRVVESELQEWLKARATPARGVLATTTDAANFERYPARYDGRR